jgi:hypothetical protein
MIDFVEKLTRQMLSWFSRREVKTPLSFFFRVIGALTLLTVTAMICSPPDARRQIFLIGTAVLVGMCLLVGSFAWFRPKNLVYGEAGYRAETKFSYGTETKEIEHDELAMLHGTENPRALTTAGGANP